MSTEPAADRTETSRLHDEILEGRAQISELRDLLRSENQRANDAIDREETAEQAALEAQQERDRLRAAVARLAQMADHWEQQLPEVIRTPAVVSAIRAVLEPAVSVVPPATNQTALLRAADFFHGLSLTGTAVTAREVEAELRRLAAEAPHTATPDERPPMDPRRVLGIDACPTPLTHNWGCGCPTDQEPAVVAQPGKETQT
jgi:hypothetical protein